MARRPSRRAERGSVSVQPQVHFLDMGKDPYGDCIIVQAGDRSVMIDGGHPRDLQGQAGTASIPEQLEEIFGHAAPFDITLIVMTHGHNDHIGCLPELVAQGIVKPRFALVSDPGHCFPPGARDLLPDDPVLGEGANETIRRVLTGLAEEDHGDLPEDELARFLDRTLKLGERYRQMVDRLEADPAVHLVRWGVTPVEALRPVYAALDGSGFDIVAPGVPQLEICRDQIVRYARDSADRLRDTLAQFDAADLSPPDEMAARLYRRNSADPAANILLDRAGQGSALNCQSIMLVFGHDDGKILLTGDMQFAAPEVPGIEPHIEDLLAQAIAAGPFRCVKLPHHSSYNGIDVALWKKLGKPELLVHSGGSEDPSHPEPSILRAFEAVDDDILFLRTDRNGLISIDFARGADGIRIGRGDADDFSVNRRRRREDERQPTLSPPAAGPATVVLPLAPASPEPADERIEVMVVRLPLDHELIVGANSIEVRRSGARSVSPVDPASAGPDPARRLAGGRALPKLLFVTNSAGLARNIGSSEAAEAIALIRRDAALLDVAGSADPQAAVRQALAKGGQVGVVLVGGYDILPAQRVDVLTPQLRQRISPADIAYDPDGFIVWSDDGWGDINGDTMADVPVSRVPDGRSAALVFAALTADGHAPDGAFGIRNEARPFAVDIYKLIAQGQQALVSAPHHVSQLVRDAPARRHVYFMLHGDDRDGSRFWGDDVKNRRVIEAINVSALPAAGLDIAFAGCCWGALSVLQRANRADAAVAPRAPEESMALGCLRAGARAFVGCTGVHYSPGEEGGFFGGPMHAAFWAEINAGRAPAEALFRARATYLRDTPHGRHTPFEVGIERKIYKQFTCLGLGW